jgi:hypothetical protein
VVPLPFGEALKLLNSSSKVSLYPVRSTRVREFGGSEFAAEQIGGEHATTKTIHAAACRGRRCTVDRGMASRNSIWSFL